MLRHAFSFLTSYCSQAFKEIDTFDKISFMHRILLAACIIAAISVTGCKKETIVVDNGINNPAPEPEIESPLPVIQRYMVTYYSAGDSANASVSLLPMKQPYNGTSFHEITDDSTVLAQGLPGRAWYNYVSRDWTFKGAPQIDFLFSRMDFKFANSVSRTDIGEVSFDTSTPSAISLADTTRFTCVATPRLADEKVHLWFMRIHAPGDDMSSSGFGLELQDNTIELTPHKTQSARPGRYRMYFVRERTMPLQTADHNAGGTIVVQLQTGEREVSFY